MRFSEYFIPTQKEVPSDAEVISHQLMVRAGMIRKADFRDLYLPSHRSQIHKKGGKDRP